MRERGTLAVSLVLLSALAVGSYWLAEQARLSDAPLRKTGHDVDYTASNTTLTRMDVNGRAEYVVDADALVHYVDDDSGELTRPRIVGSKPDRPEMRVRADSGKTTSDAAEVRLYGHVVVNRAAWRDSAPLVAKSDYMLVLPDREIVETDRPVTIVQGGSSVDAATMHYDNGTQRVQYAGGEHGRIRTVIEPRGGHQARAAATTEAAKP